MMNKAIRIASVTFAVCLLLAFLTTSIWQPFNPEDRIRSATRPYEFNYLSWTLSALWDKVSLTGLGINHYLTFRQDRQIIQDYFGLLRETNELESEIANQYANPDVADPQDISTDLQSKLQTKQEELAKQSSLAEAVIQKQVAVTLEGLGLTSLRLPFPPVLYHGSKLPKELIVSRRDTIEQVTSLSLRADMSIGHGQPGKPGGRDYGLFRAGG